VIAGSEYSTPDGREATPAESGSQTDRLGKDIGQEYTVPSAMIYHETCLLK
jgi:hypothetical protein